LVVKGADLDFSSTNQAGIDDRVLKEFLSGEGLLETISKKITATEASAVYQDGVITGRDSGLVKEYRNLRSSISQIDETIEKVNKSISGGKRFELKQQIEILEALKIIQDRARRHLAYELSRQISNLNSQLDNLPDEQISLLDKAIDAHQQKSRELYEKRISLENNRAVSKDYEWLESSHAEYQKLVLAGVSIKLNVGLQWLFLAALALVVGIVMVFVQQPYLFLGLTALSVVFAYLYFRELFRQETLVTQRGELEKIATDYTSRFGDSGVVHEATLLTKLKELQPAYASVGILSNDIQRLHAELTNSAQSISKMLKTLVGTDVNPQDWSDVVIKLQKDRENLERALKSKELELSRLNVDAYNYLQVPVSTEFDPALLQRINNLLQILTLELTQTETALQGLKQEVCALTAKNIAIEWEDLIEALNIRRQEQLEQYKTTTASLLARIKVNEVLNDLRAIEEKRIEEGLQDAAISRALLGTTSRYHQVEKSNGELHVGDDYGHYRISDLSTGAREQVLLGLRIGFAARLLEGRPLFLILDDAFQHSDWKRRENLVRTVFDLARDDWQILYFTMDDHIRSVFENRAEQEPADFYQTIDLS
jgi:uncharacterized protein YhaN